MIQFQRSTRLQAPAETLTIGGKIYRQVLKCGNPGAEKRIRDYIYNHELKNTKVFDPAGAGFFYLYAEAI